ncbi:hypothetical protein [Campylobacter sp. RM16188]|uniref:hypothetical protein n=1 Tax=Campylobacter sp. RM16188 TaxID=1705725 RepID=UPI0015523906|nr:hypothetical protein [Campylobacter sp. RM16188]
MSENYINPNVFVTPDYLEVRPLGYNPDTGNEGNGGEQGGNPGGTGGEFNPFDHLTELEQIIEEWINKEYTFEGEDLKTKLKGVLKNIKELKTEVVSINGKIKAIVTNQDIAITTDDEALAQAIQKINAKFGEITSSIDTLKQSYASSNQAIAQKFEQLKASIPSAGGIATEITKNVQTKIEQAVDGKVTSITGDLTRLKTKVDNQEIAITDAKAIATQGRNYAARVKSLATVGDRVTGWQYADGTGKTSTFEIMADNFRISNSNRSLSPFVIVGDKIRFTGNVEFDQQKQRNTIIRIERYENNSSSPRSISVSFPYGSQAAIALISKGESVVFVGKSASGSAYNSFVLPGGASAVLLYMNQEDVVDK